MKQIVRGMVVLLMLTATMAFACNGKTCSKCGSFAEKALKENMWEVQLESGGMFNIDGGASYATVPQIVSLNLNLDEIGNQGWIRGNTEFRFSTLFIPITKGPENRFFGFAAGPQYNFVQPGWNLVPYIGARVGFGFTDSQDPRFGGQGQDFCFLFMVTPGVRYFFSEQWSAAFEVNYLHASNGGLSEPERKNDGWNHLGPQVSILYSF